MKARRRAQQEKGRGRNEPVALRTALGRRSQRPPVSVQDEGSPAKRVLLVYGASVAMMIGTPFDKFKCGMCDGKQK